MGRALVHTPSCTRCALPVGAACALRASCECSVCCVLSCNFCQKVAPQTCWGGILAPLLADQVARDSAQAESQINMWLSSWHQCDNIGKQL